jgi:hypothetical protein
MSLSRPPEPVRAATMAMSAMAPSGTGRNHAAEFFRNHAEFEMARARPAIFLGDRDAEEAQLREALPQLLVVRRLAIEHDAHRFRRALFGEEAPRLIAQLLLLL